MAMTKREEAQVGSNTVTPEIRNKSECRTRNPVCKLHFGFRISGFGFRQAAEPPESKLEECQAFFAFALTEACLRLR